MKWRGPWPKSIFVHMFFAAWGVAINTVPGLSSNGNLATMAAAAGIPYEELILRVLDTAFTKPAYVP